jgi:hypothetical protein
VDDKERIEQSKINFLVYQKIGGGGQKSKGLGLSKPLAQNHEKDLSCGNGSQCLLRPLRFLFSTTTTTIAAQESILDTCGWQ